MRKMGRKRKELVAVIEPPKRKRGRPAGSTNKIVFMAMEYVKTEVMNPVIMKTPKGFRVAGHSSSGHQLSCIVSKDRALKAIENGSAKQGW